MKRKKQKALLTSLIALICLFGLFVFSSCGESRDDSSEEPITESTEETEPISEEDDPTPATLPVEEGIVSGASYLFINADENLANRICYYLVVREGEIACYDHDGNEVMTVPGTDIKEVIDFSFMSESENKLPNDGQYSFGFYRQNGKVNAYIRYYKDYSDQIIIDDDGNETFIPVDTSLLGFASDEEISMYLDSLALTAEWKIPEKQEE